MIDMVHGYVDEEIASYHNDPEFLANAWAIGSVEAVLDSLAEQGRTQTWLAGQIGVSRSRVSALLSAPPNMTYSTLARLTTAIGGIGSVTFYMDGNVFFHYLANDVGGRA